MKKIRFGAVLWALVILLACDRGFFTTPIDSILNNPRDYEGKLVKVDGIVTESINIFVVKGFKIKDKTGEIFVITDRMLPQKGSEATVKGYIKEGFSMGDERLIVIVEENVKQAG